MKKNKYISSDEIYNITGVSLETDCFLDLIKLLINDYSFKENFINLFLPINISNVDKTSFYFSKDFITIYNKLENKIATINLSLHNKANNIEDELDLNNSTKKYDYILNFDNNVLNFNWKTNNSKEECCSYNISKSLLQNIKKSIKEESLAM